VFSCERKRSPGTYSWIGTLDELPEEEQEAVVTSYLRDLRRRKQQRGGQSAGQNALYEPFQIMLDADLDLPSDYSETYVEHLYTPHAFDD
jgi:RNA polymerase-interacting CarD/CdnL/TRCF family regulator